MDKTRRFPLSLTDDSPVLGLGILTDEPDYRLCWLLNQNYPWDLARSNDISISGKNNSIPQLYACFESTGSHTPSIKLIANRSKEGLWMTVFRQVDFLLIVVDQDQAGQYLEDIKSTLASKVPQIRGLFKLALPSFCYL